MVDYITVIGAGLAGVEAANYIAKNGIKVKLYEMKKKKRTPAQHSDLFAELVCSNSLKGNSLSNACGLLKEELRKLGSLCIESADKNRVPAGDALAVDRDKFAEYITEKIFENPNIEIIDEEITKIPEGIVIIATGPLTSQALTDVISELVSEKNLYFYDAAAPVITKDSINMDICYKMARYNKGGDDYINCPFTKEQYDAFYNELVNAECVKLKEFENLKVFEGCMPVEVMAKRGFETLLFGPLKPVGLKNPKTGKDDSYAVVQLRQDNKEGTLYNMVGFQTNLKFLEQKRVFSMIPGLENAEFVRYGVMHRNTYIQGPKILDRFYRMKEHNKVFFAGQITGVEGYVESASSGIMAGYNMARMIKGEELFEPSAKNCIGALALYVSSGSLDKLQPMSANFGIIEGLEQRVRAKKEERYRMIAQRSLEELSERLKK